MEINPDPGSLGHSIPRPGVPPTPRKGGKRPGAGRPKKAPKPVERESDFDVARHVDPKTEAPEWTADLMDKFLTAYYQANISFKGACQRVGVPYRAARRHRETNADFAERLGIVEELHLDKLLEEQQRRSLEDASRPNSLMFELKSRHPAYKPVRQTGPAGVKINIAILDKTFGSQSALEALPERKALTEFVDAEITPP